METPSTTNPETPPSNIQVQSLSSPNSISKPSISLEEEITNYLPKIIQSSLSSQTSPYTPTLYYEDFEIDLIVKDYICSLCKGVICNAVLDTCGHCFCAKCYKTFQTLCGGNIKCPINGKILDGYPTLFSFVSSIIDRQIIVCHFHQEGCSFKGEVKDYLTHLDNECPKIKIKCNLEGCQEIIAREQMEEHQKKCDFRNIQCEYCKELTPYLKLVSHHSICPKYKLQCTLGCGCVIERECYDEHLKNVCSKALVKCECELFGCNVECVRDKMSEHINNSIHEHMILMFKYFNTENKKINETLESEIKKLQEKITTNNNQQQQQINTFLGKKTERTFLQTSPSPLPMNTQQQQQTATRQFLLPTKGFSRTNASIDEYPSINNTNNNTNETNTTSTTYEQPFIQTKNLSEKPAYFDMVNLPPGFKIVNNSIKMTSSLNSTHKYIFASTNVPNNKKTIWKVTFLNHPKWIGFGLCDKTIVLNNKMSFFSTNKAFNHGSFLISTNTFSWNCKVVKENNTFLNCSKLKKGDVVLLEYNPLCKELLIKCGALQKKLTEVEPIESTELTICFVFLSEGDELELTLLE